MGGTQTPRKDHVETEAEAGELQPQPSNTQSHQELQGAWKGPALQPLEMVRP